MRGQTKLAMKNIHDRLVNVRKTDPEDKNTGTQYVPMSELLESTNLSKSSTYRCIRLLREKGVGIYTRVGYGYVLAEYASKCDDVHTMRRVHGRRTSDLINLNASHKWMKKRWKTDWERRQLVGALRPLLPESGLLSKSMKILLSASNSLGV